MSDTFKDQMQRAISLHESGDLRSAQVLYQSLLSEYPERTDIKHNLGLLKLQLGDTRGGASLMVEAIDAEPDNPGMLNSPKVLGRALYNAMYWEDALVWLKKAIQIDPNDGALHPLVARITARSYLTPEVYDQNEQRTLKRFSSREAGDYIYTIDIAGTCNLRCPSWPVGNSYDPLRVKSMMPVQMFRTSSTKLKWSRRVKPRKYVYSIGASLYCTRSLMS